MARDSGGAVFTTAFNSTRVRGAAPDATARDAVGKGAEPAVGRSRKSPARSSLYLPSFCSTVRCTTFVRLAQHCATSAAVANSRVEECGGARQRPLPRALEEDLVLKAIDRETYADGLSRHPFAMGHIRLADLHPEHGPPLESRSKPTACHVVPELGEDRATQEKCHVEPCDVRTRRTSSARRCRSVFLPVPRWERRTIRHSRSPSGVKRVSRGHLKRSGEPRMPRLDNRRTDRSPLPAVASGRPGVTPRIEARKCARYRWDRSLRRPRDLARRRVGDIQEALTGTLPQPGTSIQAATTADAHPSRTEMSRFGPPRDGVEQGRAQPRSRDPHSLTGFPCEFAVHRVVQTLRAVLKQRGQSRRIRPLLRFAPRPTPRLATARDASSRYAGILPASMPSSVSCDRPIRGDFHRAGLSFHLE